MRAADEFLSKDKYLGKFVRLWAPCGISERDEGEYFASLARSIVGQQLSVKAAETVYRRLEEKVGEVSASNLLKVKVEDIRGSGVSGAKSSYLLDLSARVSEGRLLLSQINKKSDEEVMEELLKVKGIGRWTAEMFLMFSLGRKDIFPVEDVGIRNGIRRMTGQEMEKGEMASFAERWRPYRTCASWYIWKSLDNEPV